MKTNSKHGVRHLIGWIRSVKRILVPVVYASCPKGLVFLSPRVVRNPDRIFIGDDVCLGSGSILKAITRSGGTEISRRGRRPKQIFDSRITIGHRVNSEGALHIAAHLSVTVEEDVHFAYNVFIADAQHGYGDADIPYIDQPMTDPEAILIKKRSKIGRNAVIMPGVTIGAEAIICANSVVTRSIPDRCMAAGSPARIIARFRISSQNEYEVERHNSLLQWR